jgi:hypothetical protein
MGEPYLNIMDIHAIRHDTGGRTDRILRFSEIFLPGRWNKYP